MNSPWYDDRRSRSSVSSEARNSSACRPRCSVVPGHIASVSSRYAPMPTPRMNRPPDSWSRVAACLAATTGCRNAMTVMAVASRSRVVRAATNDR
jgi:hypothetical protein